MTDTHYMLRCIELAKLAGGDVGLNPNVGALLVHNHRIIGEGYYEHYGGAHAEVNAIASVKESDLSFIPLSTLYVSLEPCNFHGKTPPCTNLILKHKIKSLVVGCEDPNPKIAGSSLKYLESCGVQVRKNICNNEAKELIAPFRINITEKRPYITLKFAQSRDFYISRQGEQTWLSNDYSKVLSHKLRSLNQAILIGNRTALVDNPSLTNRLYSGGNPLRICIDKENKIDAQVKLLQDDHKTLIINEYPRTEKLKTHKEQWTMSINLSTIMKRLHSEKNVGRLIVEGGAYTIEQFMKEEMWDQAYVINCEKSLESGIKAPVVNGHLKERFKLGGDSVLIISR